MEQHANSLMQSAIIHHCSWTRKPPTIILRFCANNENLFVNSYWCCRNSSHVVCTPVQKLPSMPLLPALKSSGKMAEWQISKNKKKAEWAPTITCYKMSAQHDRERKEKTKYKTNCMAHSAVHQKHFRSYRTQFPRSASGHHTLPRGYQSMQGLQ